jgi:transposase
MPWALHRRRVTRAFKRPGICAVEAGTPVAQVAREQQLPPPLIRRWPHAHQHYAERAFLGHGTIYQCETRMAELERLIGQLTMDNALFKKALLRLEARPRGPSRPEGS